MTENRGQRTDGRNQTTEFLPSKFDTCPPLEDSLSDILRFFFPEILRPAQCTMSNALCSMLHHPNPVSPNLIPACPPLSGRRRGDTRNLSSLFHKTHLLPLNKFNRLHRTASGKLLLPPLTYSIQNPRSAIQNRKIPPTLHPAPALDPSSSIESRLPWVKDLHTECDMSRAISAFRHPACVTNYKQIWRS